MSKAEQRALEKYPANKTVFDKYEKQRYAFIYGYIQAEKDILSEYGWLVSKVKVLKLKYCHNRESVKAIEEALDILNEFRQ